MERTPLRSATIGLLTLAICLFVGLQTSPTASASSGSRLDACADADLVRAPVAQSRKAMLCLVNAVRQGRGLRPLTPSRMLDRAATRKLVDQVRCGDFTHTPCGDPFTAVFDAAGYTQRDDSWTVGENLAVGSTGFSTPRSVLDAWLASPPHRRVILQPAFRELGIAVARPASFRGEGDAVLWATAFGAR